MQDFKICLTILERYTLKDSTGITPPPPDNFPLHIYPWTINPQENFPAKIIAHNQEKSPNEYCEWTEENYAWVASTRRKESFNHKSFFKALT